MIARLYSLNKQFINLNGKLLALPKLIKAFIMDALGYGWDRNRAIDNIGTHNNALMGGYLLAASNTTITIQGLRVTGQDTIKALTPIGLVGVVNVVNTMSFTAGSKYGAFEVYRAGTLIGRYCLTERQGLQIINQVTGGLPNGLLGGTTTTVWQRSNAFYCETNITGYSISGTGWVTSAGAALTVGTIVPADPANPTKCMAWVGSVQQDLQFVGKARNSVSVIPLSVNFRNDRYIILPNLSATGVADIDITVSICGISTANQYMLAINNNPLFYIAGSGYIYIYFRPTTTAPYISTNFVFNSTISYEIRAILLNNVRSILVYNKQTGQLLHTVSETDTTIYTLESGTYTIGRSVSNNYMYCTMGSYSIKINGVDKTNLVTNQHGTGFVDTITKTTRPLNGITTTPTANIDTIHNAFNESGYELWYNGTDYQIYPLASDGARIITPAGYELVETVTAGNMPSVADSRMSTFKYALANSHALRQSVPEAYDTTDPCAPKLLTYTELSALSANPKVIKTEADGKITNIKIIQ